MVGVNISRRLDERTRSQHYSEYGERQPQTPEISIR